MQGPRSIPGWEKGIYAIRTDPAAIDFEAACGFLRSAPWAAGLSHEAMKRALRNSLCFSLFEKERQIGLARVISDFATYAYLCDVYIEESRRHRGLGTWLIRCVLDHPDISCLKRIALITHDAHDFYRPFGFQFASPNHYMERLSSSAARSTEPPLQTAISFPQKSSCHPEAKPKDPRLS